MSFLSEICEREPVLLTDCAKDQVCLWSSFNCVSTEKADKTLHHKICEVYI